MTDPMHRPEGAADPEREFEAGPEVLRLAAKIFSLARQGDAATLAAYVDAGVAADLCNDKGDTLIMLAAYHSHPQTVAALLARGADPNRANDRGQTPFASAVFKGERVVIEALLGGGADPAAGRPSAVDGRRYLVARCCSRERRASVRPCCWTRRRRTLGRRAAGC